MPSNWHAWPANCSTRWRAPLALGDIRLAVRPSIGIAMHPTHGLAPDELMRNPDAAMYRAKRAQLGYAFCDGPDGA